MLLYGIVMAALSLLRKKWLILAAGLVVSCFLNPQPEPPGGQPGPNGHSMGGAAMIGNGGAGYNVPVGGSYNASTNPNGLGGMAANMGGVTQGTGSSDKVADEDAGAHELDASPEPVTVADPVE